ncbi:MAG: peptidoglycan-binding protein [Bacteroidales bacterium]|nr:peptidoglycan-binding protein [Bacteroidales bacterium]
MSTFKYLQIGDTLPMVSILQLLLNRQAERKGITVDGVFGPKTRKAVIDFQKLKHIKVDGSVGQETWPKLIEGTGFRIIDSVDVTEDWMGNTENRLDPFNRVGANPIVVGAMCNGLAEAIRQIRSRAGNPSSLVLLRFHGHGGPGKQGISFGRRVIEDRNGYRIFISPDELSSIESTNLEKIEPELRKLRSIFGVYTCVELHGCKVALGKIGRDFIKRLAEIWNVPVSAGTISQYRSTIKETFSFEGRDRVFTAFPGGRSFKTWSESLPRLTGVCLL